MRDLDIDVSRRPYVEHFDGEVRLKMAPSPFHMLVQPRVAAVLERCAGERGFVGTEPHMRVGAADGTDTVFVPDVAFISNERLSEARHRGTAVPEFGPDIAVEIRLPGADVHELERKVKKYLSCGTPLVLDVNPDARTITAHGPSGDVRRFSSEQTFAYPTFPWLQFEVKEIFTSLDRYERLTANQQPHPMPPK
jgi:Uma2 family endonuclease